MTNYTETIIIKVTPEQKKFITKEAKKFELTTSQYIRLRLGYPLYAELPTIAEYKRKEENNKCVAYIQE